MNETPPVWFRWDRRNRYSIAALRPLVRDAGLADGPRPGIMLYSFATAQAEEVYAEVSGSKVDAIYVAGGPHPSAKPEEALEHFDFVVIGEGEEALPRLIRAIRCGADPGSIPGLAYKRGDTVVRTRPGEPVDLDMYPPFEPPLLGPIEISRGCPWGCAYCQTPRLCGRRMRHRSVSAILKYARFYSDLRFTSPNALAYGSDGIKPDLEKVERLLKRLSSFGKPIYFGTFPSEVRPDFVSEEALDLLVRYCTNRTLSIGAQSGSDKILKAIGRGHGLADVQEACDICFGQDMVPNVDIILGLPMEEPLDQEMTANLAREIVEKGGMVRAHYFTPLPGTPLERSEPVRVEEDVARLLGRLARSGKLTGKWTPQM